MTTWDNDAVLKSASDEYLCSEWAGGIQGREKVKQVDIVYSHKPFDLSMVSIRLLKILISLSTMSRKKSCAINCPISLLFLLWEISQATNLSRDGDAWWVSLLLPTFQHLLGKIIIDGTLRNLLVLQPCYWSHCVETMFFF